MQYQVGCWVGIGGRGGGRQAGRGRRRACMQADRQAGTHREAYAGRQVGRQVGRRIGRRECDACRRPHPHQPVLGLRPWRCGAAVRCARPAAARPGQGLRPRGRPRPPPCPQAPGWPPGWQGARRRRPPLRPPPPPPPGPLLPATPVAGGAGEEQGTSGGGFGGSSNVGRCHVGPWLTIASPFCRGVVACLQNALQCRPLSSTHLGQAHSSPSHPCGSPSLSVTRRTHAWRALEAAQHQGPFGWEGEEEAGGTHRQTCRICCVVASLRRLPSAFNSSSLSSACAAGRRSDSSWFSTTGMPVGGVAGGGACRGTSGGVGAGDGRASGRRGREQHGCVLAQHPLAPQVHPRWHAIHPPAVAPSLAHHPPALRSH